MGIQCPKCHFENADDSKFCKECGTQVISSEEVPASPTKTLETPTEELTRGTTFAGRYEIIEELGKGGMGVVYKAEDTRLKRTVALKFLPPELTSNVEAKERFVREAQAAAALDHPNICTVHEIDEAEDKTFISMAFIEGQSLKEKNEQEPLEINEALEIAIQVAEGLEEAHKKGVVHRDIKSANIMVTETGLAKIMDFGIALLLTSDSMTQSGMMIGTPHYMSPEQVASEKVDLRSDIYSLGVVLYEMVTGRLPFQGDSAISVALKHKTDLPKNPRELDDKIPKELSVLILKCLKKNKEKRFQSAKDLLLELKTIEKRIPATDKTLLKRKTLQKRRIRVFTILGILLSVALITVGGYFIYERFLKGKIGEKEEKIPVVPGLTTLEKKELIPQYGIVEINSFPDRAEVYLDNKREGVTPFKRELKPGDYQIQIKKEPGYKEISEVLNVKAGETFSKSYTLNLIYILNINTIPEGADIKIDGNYKGKSPVQIEIPRNKCQVTIEKGIQWTKIDEQLTLNPGKNLIQRSLEKIKYSLFIKTNPPGARVFIEDKLIGISPLRKVDLFGECDIKIEKDGYVIISDSVAMNSNLEKTYDLKELEPEVTKSEKVKSEDVAAKEPSAKIPFGKQPINAVLEPIDFWTHFGLNSGKVSYPINVAIDNSGFIYVSDFSNKLISKFASDGRFVGILVSQVEVSGNFLDPLGIVLDNSGNLYVCDSSNHRIMKFNIEGEYIKDWGAYGKGKGQLIRPKGLALDNSGNLYVCDSGNHRIMKFSIEGEYIKDWGAYGKGKGKFDNPTGIAVHNSGFVFVADQGNKRIQVFSVNGEFTNEFGASQSIRGISISSKFKSPAGIALDDLGYIYVTDIGNHKVFKFTFEGSLVTERGSLGKKAGQFFRPWGIAVDNSGYAYIADTNNNRIQRFKIK